ncbi:MAG: acyl-CoA thioesterase domain-containing protein, partial [Actinomycetota bacterium]
MPDSFFTTSEEAVFVPSDLTIGPWSRAAQHGSPPAALLGRAIERASGEEKQVVRVVFDILKPVPLRPLRVATTVVRPGKKVALIEASLQADGEVVMRAAGWAIRIAELDLP